MTKEVPAAEFAFADALLALAEVDPAAARRVRDRWSDVGSAPIVRAWTQSLPAAAASAVT